MLEDNAQSTTMKKGSMVDLRSGMLLWGVWSIEEKRKTKRLDLDITHATPHFIRRPRRAIGADLKGHFIQLHELESN
jgi:hypothetical protein